MALGAPEVPFDESHQVCTGMQVQKVRTGELRGGPAPVRMSRFRIAPGAASPLDNHPDREIWMVAQGQGILTYRGEQMLRVSGGDVLEFEPAASHTIQNTGSTDLLVFSVWWEEGG